MVNTAQHENLTASARQLGVRFIQEGKVLARGNLTLRARPLVCELNVIDGGMLSAVTCGSGASAIGRDIQRGAKQVGAQMLDAVHAAPLQQSQVGFLRDFLGFVGIPQSFAKKTYESVVPLLVPGMSAASASDRACSVVIEVERERRSYCCFFHFSRSQSGNAITDIALGDGLKIIEVRGARLRQSVIFGQHHFRGDAANRRSNWRNGYRVENSDCGVARQNQHGSFLVSFLECVLADVAWVHDVPRSCSLSQTSNSPGETGFRA
jgi:hypothetical protein